MSPDKRQHRGAHPADRDLFSSDKVEVLRVATSELSWLLSRGYSQKAAIKLVGDKHSLTERQRIAISRSACSDESLAKRNEGSVAKMGMRGSAPIIDGFNLLITVEAALSGGLLLLCRDSSIRDMSSVHGSYRSVNETLRALEIIGEGLDALGCKSARWILDKPISNSGRLAQQIRKVGAERHWPWTVDVLFNPDAEICASGTIAVTSDSTILDNVDRWFNFKEFLREIYFPGAWVVDLRV